MAATLSSSVNRPGGLLCPGLHSATGSFATPKCFALLSPRQPLTHQHFVWLVLLPTHNQQRSGRGRPPQRATPRRRPPACRIQRQRRRGRHRHTVVVVGERRCCRCCRGLCLQLAQPPKVVHATIQPQMPTAGKGTRQQPSAHVSQRGKQRQLGAKLCAAQPAPAPPAPPAAMRRCGDWWRAAQPCVLSSPSPT